MTGKEKAIEDETVELSIEPTEKKKPHRRRAVVITVVALALLAAGGIAWKTHTDRLMAEARADCAAESERLHVATTAYNALLDDQAASMANTDVKSVKDAKTLDALSKAMKASTPKTVSCKADSRDAVVTATKAVTANASWYKAHTKSLNGLVNAVETSKLDKTVDDADALYKETDGKVADGKTRASLLDAIKKRDAAAIAKAVKAVNESRAAWSRSMRRRRPGPNRKPPRRPPRSRPRHRNPSRTRSAHPRTAGTIRIRPATAAAPRTRRRNPPATAAHPRVAPVPTCAPPATAREHPAATPPTTSAPAENSSRQTSSRNWTTTNASTTCEGYTRSSAAKHGPTPASPNPNQNSNTPKDGGKQHEETRHRRNHREQRPRHKDRTAHINARGRERHEGTRTQLERNHFVQHRA